MNEIIEVIAEIVRLTTLFATPLLFAALGELFGQRSGVLNLGVEGQMLMGGFIAIYTVSDKGLGMSPWIGLLAAIVIGILFGLAVYIGVTIWGSLMQSVAEFYALAAIVGLAQGGVQALSRSLFGAMSPKAKTAEFFGFYGMSSKFAGIVGPLLFAVVGQMAGSSRLSIVSLIIFFIVGGFLLSRVDEAEGIRVARAEDAAAAIP